jgi:spore coat polysaccharide biosynthesis predicted glycosyltransferase SpsG
LKDKWLKIVALIDTGAPKYRANLYIHCGTNDKIKSDYMFENSRFIGGAEYLPIRKSIREIKYKSKNIRHKDPIRILIIGGGTDPLNFVSSLSLELQELQQEFEAIIVSEKVDILKLLDRRFAQIAIGESFEKELVKTDLVLTLAGTSSWEFLSSGFPLGIALGFDNQRDNFEFQRENRLAIDIGNFNKEKVFEFNRKNLLEILENRELRAELSLKANSSVDGLGAIRIVRKLVELSGN